MHENPESEVLHSVQAKNIKHLSRSDILYQKGDEYKKHIEQLKKEKVRFYKNALYHLFSKLKKWRDELLSQKSTITRGQTTLTL